MGRREGMNVVVVNVVNVVDKQQPILFLDQKRNSHSVLIPEPHVTYIVELRSTKKEGLVMVSYLFLGRFFPCSVTYEHSSLLFFLLADMEISSEKQNTSHSTLFSEFVYSIFFSFVGTPTLFVSHTRLFKSMFASNNRKLHGKCTHPESTEN
jgi:hypothetical protein